MPEFYSTDEVTKDKFLFISYSHENKPLVEACARYLLDEGVRLWYDKALTATSEWPTVIETLLRHENCCGAFLFCSPQALASTNVAKERNIVLQERQKRGKENYRAFFVVVTQDKPISYVQLIRNALNSVAENQIDAKFPLENLSVLMELIGNDAIYRMTHEPEYEKTLLSDIHTLVPQTINKSVILREVMEAHAGADRIIDAEFGHWKDGNISVPIRWHLIGEENGIADLLCQQPLCEGNGGADLQNWLCSTFLSNAFTAEEQALLLGTPRLLTAAEAGKLDPESLASGQQWWLAECRGNLQMIVREDGTIYRNGYNNKTFEKGIRPVISMGMEDISKIVLEQ